MRVGDGCERLGWLRVLGTVVRVGNGCEGWGWL